MIRSVMNYGITALALSSVFVAASAAQAQTFPSQPIQLVVPSSSGGGLDVLARTFSDSWSQALGQPVVVEVRPGAGGIVGTSVVAEAEPDGYTLLFVTTGFVTNPSLRETLPYETPDDFTPITIVGITNNVLIAHPDSGFETLDDVISAAEADPGGISFGSSGVGSGGHLSMELLLHMADIDMTHVTYQGAGASSAALVGGEVSLLFTSLTAAMPYIQSGDAIPLAVTGAQRASVYPDVPTVAEAGLPGFQVDGWYGLLGPAGLPDDVLDTIYSTLVETINDPDVAARIEALGFDVNGISPAEFSDYLVEEMETWEVVINERGITAN